MKPRFTEGKSLSTAGVSVKAKLENNQTSPQLRDMNYEASATTIKYRLDTFHLWIHEIRVCVKTTWVCGIFCFVDGTRQIFSKGSVLPIRWRMRNLVVPQTEGGRTGFQRMRQRRVSPEWPLTCHSAALNGAFVKAPWKSSSVWPTQTPTDYISFSFFWKQSKIFLVTVEKNIWKKNS